MLPQNNPLNLLRRIYMQKGGVHRTRAMMEQDDFPRPARPSTSTKSRTCMAPERNAQKQSHEKMQHIPCARNAEQHEGR